MSDNKQTVPEWKILSKPATGGVGDRNLRLWDLLNQASEIIDGIEITLRANREQARESARAAADATSPESLRLIDLVREMHANALQDQDHERRPANRVLGADANVADRAFSAARANDGDRRARPAVDRLRNCR